MLCAAVVPAAADYADLARALGYASSASLDCNVPAFTDAAREQAIRGFWETGDYATEDGLIAAYMGSFNEGKTAFFYAKELALAMQAEGDPKALTAEDLCLHASESILKEMH